MNVDKLSDLSIVYERHFTILNRFVDCGVYVYMDHPYRLYYVHTRPGNGYIGLDAGVRNFENGRFANMSCPSFCRYIGLVDKTVL